MSKIVIIGAGKTGRGFVGRLLKDEDIIYIDNNTELVKKMNEKKSFKVSFFGNRAESVVINNFNACTWENADLEDAELIFVSVCGQNLQSVGESLKKLLKDDKRYYIITCENASKPAQTLQNAIGKENVCVSESTVFCTTIEDGELDINSENYPYLQCNAELLCGYLPENKNIRPIENFSNFLTRKLYTYNAASCVIAYLGYIKGYTNYGDAANDEDILRLLDRNYAVTNKVLCKEFGYEEEDQKEFALLSKKKFCDKTIVDTVERNARQPQRKLGAAERIIGPMKLIYENSEDYEVLAMTAAAALLYTSPSDTEWEDIKSHNTYSEILEKICGLSSGSELAEKILKYTDVGKENLIDIINQK